MGYLGHPCAEFASLCLWFPSFRLVGMLCPPGCFGPQGSDAFTNIFSWKINKRTTPCCFRCPRDREGSCLSASSYHADKSTLSQVVVIPRHFRHFLLLLCNNAPLHNNQLSTIDLFSWHIWLSLRPSMVPLVLKPRFAEKQKTEPGWCEMYIKSIDQNQSNSHKRFCHRWSKLCTLGFLACFQRI